MHRRLFCWKIVELLIIFGLGLVIHFGYDWFPKWKVLAGIFAVNESIWEHCKLTFWASLIFAMAEWTLVRKDVCNFIIAKTADCFVACILMVMLFYTYTGIIGFHTLAMDILIFAVAVTAGQLVSHKILILNKFPWSLNFIAGLSLVFVIFLFYFFAYYPPHIPFFRDPESGGYGTGKAGQTPQSAKVGVLNWFF